MKGTRTIFIRLFCLGFLIGTLTFNFAHASAPKRIALLPFKINSDKDFSYLNDGIFNMLTSRLSKNSQVEVLSKASVDAAIQSIIKFEDTGDLMEIGARRIGAHLNADFALFGSLTILGNNLNVETKMVDVSSGVQTRIFFNQSRKLSNVIPIMNMIAARANYMMTRNTLNDSTAEAIFKDKSRKALPSTTQVLPEKKDPKLINELKMEAVPSPKTSPPAEIEHLNERTIRRENWLLSQDESYFTIQIMGIHNETFLLSFIEKNQLLKQNEIAYYRSIFNGMSWYPLLYGIFPTRKDAQRAIHELPENLRQAKPWICRISTVQKTIRDRLKQ